MRTEKFEGGQDVHFDENEKRAELLDNVETMLAGKISENKEKDLKNLAAHLRIKIEESKKELPN